MKEQTPTPRTDEYDANLMGCCHPLTHYEYMTNLARTLERELAEKDAQIATLESERENWRVSSVARELRAGLDAAQAQIVAMHMPKERTPSGMYENEKLQAMWESWQARASKEVKA